jgi:hypothetical protein
MTENQAANYSIIDGDTINQAQQIMDLIRNQNAFSKEEIEELTNLINSKLKSNI